MGKMVSVEEAQRDHGAAAQGCTRHHLSGESCSIQEVGTSDDFSKGPLHLQGSAVISSSSPK